MFCQFTAGCFAFIFGYLVFHIQTPQEKDTTVATIHVEVVWSEGGPPPRWEAALQKALQTWFNKNVKNTFKPECIKVTDQEGGRVRLDIKQASGNYRLDFFLDGEHDMNIQSNV